MITLSVQLFICACSCFLCTLDKYVIRVYLSTDIHVLKLHIPVKLHRCLPSPNTLGTEYMSTVIGVLLLQKRCFSPLTAFCMSLWCELLHQIAILVFAAASALVFQLFRLALASLLMFCLLVSSVCYTENRRAFRKWELDKITQRHILFCSIYLYQMVKVFAT